MKAKQNKFRKLVKNNKGLLVEAGLSLYAVRSWIYTNRVPSEPNAKKIAAALGVSLAEIPYYRTERI